MVKKINDDQKHRAKILSKFKTQKQGRYYCTPITQTVQAGLLSTARACAKPSNPPMTPEKVLSQGNTKLTIMCVIGEDSKTEQSKCLMISKHHKPKNLNTL